MKIFREMVSLVTSERMNKIAVLNDDPLKSSDNLSRQLFQGIANGTYTTDEEAAIGLYQSHSSDKKYQMLKSRLKDKLINTLFFVNHNKIQETPYQRAVYQCNRNYFCAKLLLTHGARTSAVSMAKNVLGQSEKFDLNEITYLCARMLRHHASMRGLKKDYTQYDSLLLASFKKLRAQNHAERMYEVLIMEFARSKAFRPELELKAKDYFRQTKELAKYQSTFHLTILYYRIGTIYYQISRNYVGLLKLCSRHQQYLKKHSLFYTASGEGEIALLKMVCCIHLGDFNQGKLNANEALKLYKNGSINWFVVMENYFLLTMHVQKFEQANGLLEEAIHNSGFHLLSEEKIETWKIFEAYLNYLFPGKLKLKNFKINKFLNEVPIYSKDKAGFYPAILIAQVFYLIDLGDDDKSERNIESLRIFSSRYLTGNKAPRTALFIKMLRQLVNYNYDLKKVRQRSLTYLHKLKVSKQNSGGEADSMEIIPYENAWEILLARLSEKRKSAN